MATNPMQKKTRTAFILGMLLMLVVTIAAVALLYMKIQNQEKELENFKNLTGKTYVLNQDVKSGQALTMSMFSMQDATVATTPANATNNIGALLANAALIDTNGNPISSAFDVEKNSFYYYYKVLDKEGKEAKLVLYTDDNQQATALYPGQKVFFTDTTNNNEKKYIEIDAASAVVAKINMSAKTIITSDLVTPGDEILTNDLRKEEYNVIALPVDLNPGEYVDIRLTLPNGQNFIVVSKKKVSIPVVNGQYSPDSIQMNLSEDEILNLSCAIVENFKMDGSKLYASRYIEAGIQDAAVKTYSPNGSVRTLIQNDPNILESAKKAIAARYPDIDRELSAHGTEDNVQTKVEQEVTATKDARKTYLQTLPVVPQ